MLRKYRSIPIQILIRQGRHNLHVRSLGALHGLNICDVIDKTFDTFNDNVIKIHNVKTAKKIHIDKENVKKNHSIKKN